MNAQTALEAIRARIRGEWDNPALVEYGPLKVSKDADILDIIAAVKPGRTSKAFAIAQLRHAYQKLNDESVVKQKEFANGLIGPAIAILEAED